ncbi:MAG: hypothetical protein WC023_01980 [Rhodocyclaceae bacterium]
MSTDNFDEQVLAAMDKASERGYTLQTFIETAATMMSDTPQQAVALERDLRRDGNLFAALVLAQAILDGADVCTARLERIADTLDDLVEAIERTTEGGEVSGC